jgi:cytochrome c biogenesis protein CcdA
MDLGLFGALLGGVLTLLSPCSVMLLPAFFSYAFTSPTALLARTGTFYLGLITTLVPLGVLAGTLGAFVSSHRTLLVTTASAVVVVLGVIMLLGIPIPMLSRTNGMESTSTASVYALGTVYGLAGVCAGPLLGAVLSLAAIGGNALYGGIILLVFAAGMALPLLLLALVWGRFPFVRGWVRPREVAIGRWTNTWTSIVGGLLTVTVGVFLLFTSGTTSLGGVLDTSQQFRLESWVMRHAGGVPDLAVAIGTLAVVGSIWVLARAARRRQAPPATAGNRADPHEGRPPR